MSSEPLHGGSNKRNPDGQQGVDAWGILSELDGAALISEDLTIPGYMVKAALK